MKKCPSHRFLAIQRGESEGVLSYSVSVDNSRLKDRLERIFIKNNSSTKEYIERALKDSIKRLLCPSLSNEFIELKKKEEIEIKI